MDALRIDDELATLVDAVAMELERRPSNGRELALVRTKLEEARMWLQASIGK
jgi:predicted transcriptional regulator